MGLFDFLIGGAIVGTAYANSHSDRDVEYEKRRKRNTQLYRRRNINVILERFPDVRDCTQEKFAEFIEHTSPTVLATWVDVMDFFLSHRRDYYVFWKEPLFSSDVMPCPRGRLKFKKWQREMLAKRIGDATSTLLAKDAETK